MHVEIDRTVKTPAVLFRRGKMSIAGRSILEDSNLFYKTLNDLLENYPCGCNHITRIDLNFEYLNSSSMRCLVSMIRILEKDYEPGRNIVINWYYEYEDVPMYEMGQIIKSLTKIPVNILEIDTCCQPNCNN